MPPPGACVEGSCGLAGSQTGPSREKTRTLGSAGILEGKYIVL